MILAPIRTNDMTNARRPPPPHPPGLQRHHRRRRRPPRVRVVAAQGPEAAASEGSLLRAPAAHPPAGHGGALDRHVLRGLRYPSLGLEDGTVRSRAGGEKKAYCFCFSFLFFFLQEHRNKRIFHRNDAGIDYSCLRSSPCLFLFLSPQRQSGQILVLCCFPTLAIWGLRWGLVPRRFVRAGSIKQGSRRPPSSLTSRICMAMLVLTAAGTPFPSPPPLSCAPLPGSYSSSADQVRGCDHFLPALGALPAHDQPLRHQRAHDQLFAPQGCRGQRLGLKKAIRLERNKQLKSISSGGGGGSDLHGASAGDPTPLKWQRQLTGVVAATAR